MNVFGEADTSLFLFRLKHYRRLKLSRHVSFVTQWMLRNVEKGIALYFRSVKRLLRDLLWRYGKKEVWFLNVAPSIIISWKIWLRHFISYSGRWEDVWIWTDMIQTYIEFSSLSSFPLSLDNNTHITDNYWKTCQVFCFLLIWKQRKTIYYWSESNVRYANCKRWELF